MTPEKTKGRRLRRRPSADRGEATRDERAYREHDRVDAPVALRHAGRRYFTWSDLITRARWLRCTGVLLDWAPHGPIHRRPEAHAPRRRAPRDRRRKGRRALRLGV